MRGKSAPLLGTLSVLSKLKPQGVDVSLILCADVELQCANKQPGRQQQKLTGSICVSVANCRWLKKKTHHYLQGCRLDPGQPKPSFGEKKAKWRNSILQLLVQSPPTPAPRRAAPFPFSDKPHFSFITCTRRLTCTDLFTSRLRWREGDYHVLTAPHALLLEGVTALWVPLPFHIHFNPLFTARRT